MTEQERRVLETGREWVRAIRDCEAKDDHWRNTGCRLTGKPVEALRAARTREREAEAEHRNALHELENPDA